MHSIKTKITAMTVCVIVIAMVIATVFGVTAIRDIGNRDAEQTLLLLCETGQKDLNYYFQNVEGSVETVASYVESDLDGLDDEKLQAHMDRVSDVFQKLVYNTNGVLTYYYRGLTRKSPGTSKASGTFIRMTTVSRSMRLPI